MSEERFIVTLRALASPTPADVRLRQALKLLRRAFAFDCVQITEAPSTDPDGEGRSTDRPAESAGVQES